MSSKNPSAGSSGEALLGKVAEEFLKQLWSGQDPTIEQFADSYPEVASLIREVFPTLLLAAEVESQTPSLVLHCPNPDCDDGRLYSVNLEDHDAHSRLIWRELSPFDSGGTN